MFDTNERNLHLQNLEATQFARVLNIVGFIGAFLEAAVQFISYLLWDLYVSVSWTSLIHSLLVGLGLIGVYLVQRQQPLFAVSSIVVLVLGALRLLNAIFGGDTSGYIPSLPTFLVMSLALFAGVGLLVALIKERNQPENKWFFPIVGIVFLIGKGAEAAGTSRELFMWIYEFYPPEIALLTGISFATFYLLSLIFLIFLFLDQGEVYSKISRSPTKAYFTLAFGIVLLFIAANSWLFYIPVFSDLWIGEIGGVLLLIDAARSFRAVEPATESVDSSW